MASKAVEEATAVQRVESETCSLSCCSMTLRLPMVELLESRSKAMDHSHGYNALSRILIEPVAMALLELTKK